MQHQECPVSRTTTSSPGHVTVSHSPSPSPPSSTHRLALPAAPVPPALKTIEGNVGNFRNGMAREEKRDGEGRRAREDLFGNFVRIPSPRGGTFAGGPKTCQVPQATPPPLPRPPDPLPRRDTMHSTVLLSTSSPIPPGADPAPISRSSAVLNGQTPPLTSSTHPAPIAETIVGDGLAKRTAVPPPALSRPTLDQATVLSPPAISRMLVNGSATLDAPAAAPPPVPRYPDPAIPPTKTSHSKVLSPSPCIPSLADLQPIAYTSSFPSPTRLVLTDGAIVPNRPRMGTSGTMAALLRLTRLPPMVPSLPAISRMLVNGSTAHQATPTTSFATPRCLDPPSFATGTPRSPVVSSLPPITPRPPAPSGMPPPSPRAPDPPKHLEPLHLSVLSPPCNPSLVDLQPIACTISLPLSTRQAPSATSPPLPRPPDTPAHLDRLHLAPVLELPPTSTSPPGADPPPISGSSAESNMKMFSSSSPTRLASIAETIIDDGRKMGMPEAVVVLSRPTTALGMHLPATASRTVSGGSSTHGASPSFPPLPNPADSSSFPKETTHSTVLSPPLPSTTPPGADPPLIPRSLVALASPASPSTSRTHSMLIATLIVHEWSKMRMGRMVSTLSRLTLAPPTQRSSTTASRTILCDSSTHDVPPAAPSSPPDLPSFPMETSHSPVLSPSTVRPGAISPPIARSLVVSYSSPSFPLQSTRLPLLAGTIVHDRSEMGTARSVTVLSRPIFISPTTLSPPSASRMVISGCFANLAPPAMSPPPPRPPKAPGYVEASHSPVLSPQPCLHPGAVSSPIARSSVPLNSLVSSVIKTVEGDGRNAGNEKKGKEKRDDVGWGVKNSSALQTTPLALSRPPDAPRHLDSSCLLVPSPPPPRPSDPPRYSLKLLHDTVLSPLQLIPPGSHTSPSQVLLPPPPRIRPGPVSRPITRSSVVSHSLLLSLPWPMVSAPTAETIALAALEMAKSGSVAALFKPPAVLSPAVVMPPLLLQRDLNARGKWRLGLSGLLAPG